VCDVGEHPLSKTVTLFQLSEGCFEICAKAIHVIGVLWSIHSAVLTIPTLTRHLHPYY